VFEDNIFEKWLDNRTKDIVVKMGNGEALTSDEMITLVLKAQTNHFVHLDQDLRTDMMDLRSDMQEMNARLSQEMIDLRKDMDKRFEQVDKRFEQVDKRFEALTTRIDRFMIWSFATTITVGGIVIASIKLIN